jgi:hypothetical protein
MERTRRNEFGRRPIADADIDAALAKRFDRAIRLIHALVRCAVRIERKLDELSLDTSRASRS